MSSRKKTKKMLASHNTGWVDMPLKSINQSAYLSIYLSRERDTETIVKHMHNGIHGLLLVVVVVEIIVVVVAWKL